MGIIDDKRNVFNQIKTYSTIGQTVDIPKNKDELIKSINTQKNDVMGFLTDILKTVAGSAAIKELTGQLLTTFLDDAEQTIKTSVKSQLTQFDANVQLPIDFINNGVNVKAPKIDLTNKLKVDPNSNIGDLLYDKTNINFDKVSYDAIVADGTEINFNNLKVKYNSLVDEFNYKPNISSPNVNIGEWVGDYVDNTEFINKKEFVSNILNDLYGTVSKSQDKSIESIIDDLKINGLIDNFINNNGENISLTPEELKKIENNAKEIKNGIINFNMTCGLVSAELPLSGLTSLIETISGSTDPFVTANAIDNTLNNTFENTNNDEVIKNNKTSINDNFFSRLIQFLKTEFSKIVAVSPQARMLLSVTSSFKNEGIPQLGDIEQDLNYYKNIMKCIIKDLLTILYKFMFTMAIGLLMTLLKPILKKVTKEKVEAYKNIITSLISSEIDKVKNIV